MSVLLLRMRQDEVLKGQAAGGFGVFGLDAYVSTGPEIAGLPRGVTVLGHPA